MRYLDLTLAAPAANLALDEALLLEAESARDAAETLRLWEPERMMVVLGRSSKLTEEVNLRECGGRGTPIFRRESGGAAVLAGPGCLMYALVLDCRLRPMLRAVDRAHRFVLDRLAGALRPLVPGVCCRGTSDLALGQAKFSGNSIRLKRDHLLYHGTLLYDFPLELIDRCLAMPPRQPDYRRGRPHAAFLANLPLDVAVIRRALLTAFCAAEPLADWPQERTAGLVAEKYSRQAWNRRS